MAAFRWLGALVAGFWLAVGPWNAASAASEPVDLELIIAVDVSNSVDAYEARLQREGYVAAFSDAQVIEAIQSGFFGRVAVLYFEWAGLGFNRIVMDWTVIQDVEGARAFAAELGRQSYSSARRTSISEAIDFAVPLFEKNDYIGKRKVIDISGDGPNNSGRPVTQAREAALAAGITINGLPIVDNSPGYSRFAWIPDLDLYYEHCVIGGRGSFMIVANGFADFANAIRQKLVLEIAGLTPAEQPAAKSAAAGPAGWRALSRPADGSPLVAVQNREPPSCTAGDFGGNLPFDRYDRY